MTQTDIILLNFEEIRRRSIKLWLALLPDNYNWKPDNAAMTIIEMIRHVLEAEHLFNVIVNNRGNIGNYVSPWENMIYKNVQTEIDFAKPYREQFFKTIQSFSNEDFSTVEIIRTEVNQHRILGDYLQRIAYHEAVHTGQMLSYYRTMGNEIPLIWD